MKKLLLATSAVACLAATGAFADRNDVAKLEAIVHDGTTHGSYTTVHSANKGWREIYLKDKLIPTYKLINKLKIYDVKGYISKEAIENNKMLIGKINLNLEQIMENLDEDEKYEYSDLPRMVKGTKEKMVDYLPKTYWSVNEHSLAKRKEQKK